MKNCYARGGTDGENGKYVAKNAEWLDFIKKVSCDTLRRVTNAVPWLQMVIQSAGYVGGDQVQ